MPKVSVIIPNYNHARFLPKRIESVLNQTFQDFEIIFMDDASTDDSLKVFASFADDQRVRSIFNGINSGSPFRQWARGLNEAKGEYVWIAESDDFADVEFLGKLTTVLDDNPEVGLVYSQSWVVDNKNALMYENLKWTDDLDPKRWSNEYINDGQDEISRFLVQRNTIPNASAVLFRRDIALANDAIDENMLYCGDWFCWINILLNSNIAYLPQSLNCWRQSHSASVRGTIKSGRRISEILHVLGFLSENVNVDPALFKKIIRKHYRQWLKSALVGNISWSDHREIVEKFGRFIPNLKMSDAFYAPLFWARAIRGRRCQEN